LTLAGNGPDGSAKDRAEIAWPQVDDDERRLRQGVRLLGFNIRRYRKGKSPTKASRGAVKRVRNRLAAEVRAPAL
jgi:hypothetical protein